MQGFKFAGPSCISKNRRSACTLHLCTYFKRRFACALHLLHAQSQSQSQSHGRCAKLHRRWFCHELRTVLALGRQECLAHGPVHGPVRGFSSKTCRVRRRRKTRPTLQTAACTTVSPCVSLSAHQNVLGTRAIAAQHFLVLMQMQMLIPMIKMKLLLVFLLVSSKGLLSASRVC